MQLPQGLRAVHTHLKPEPAYPRVQQGSVGVEGSSEVEAWRMVVAGDIQVDVVVRRLVLDDA